MSRAVPLAAAALVLAALVFALPSSRAGAAVGACARRGDEVRFDDGRLLVERSERDVDPRTARERWWTCWRPTGRRALIADRRHRAGVDELSLLAVRSGRYVVLAGAARLEVRDARNGRRTAVLPQLGAVRQLVVTASGRAAALQDAGTGQRVLYGGNAARGCLLDAGTPTAADGSLFGDLSVQGERVQWFREGVTFGATLAALSCPAG